MAVRELIERIEPPENSVEAVERHESSLARAISKKDSKIKVFQTGSHSRGTAIRGHSDADYFALFSRKHFRSKKQMIPSQNALARLRRWIRPSFPHTDMRKDEQALVVDFSGGNVDVVPAVYARPLSGDDGFPVYLIPDGGGGWLETSPPALARSFAIADRATGGRLKYLVRAIKKLNTSLPARMRSLYIECALAESQIGREVARPYTELVRDALAYLLTLDGSEIPDPSGLDGGIKACSSHENWAFVREALERALALTDQALAAEGSGSYVEAVALWRQIIFGEMPLQEVIA